MDTSHNEHFQGILSNYKSAEDNFILYNDIITKIQNTHSALLTKNTFNFCNYSLNLDLLFFNKQIIDEELENFIKYKKNCLRKFYQDLFLLLKDATVTSLLKELRFIMLMANSCKQLSMVVKWG